MIKNNSFIKNNVKNKNMIFHHNFMKKTTFLIVLTLGPGNYCDTYFQISWKHLLERRPMPRFKFWLGFVGDLHFLGVRHVRLRNDLHRRKRHRLWWRMERTSLANYFLLWNFGELNSGDLNTRHVLYSNGDLKFEHSKSGNMKSGLFELWISNGRALAMAIATAIAIVLTIWELVHSKSQC